ncbi:hypothetical protein OG585_47290 (plasmid) [Streptomyces sp. NBC_01340]|uniref:hypothetical protein n=1 Tax=unclassified Streptomyces TaxID=2593676 RepID=UPI002250C9F2|nr:MULTISPECIES: hypothetical protein [unclassified Streptomyces]MCX4461141.1 hypothetical protein [Streptomyces sp. NBC_01719]MCX4499530.1 hypothetical protein [Streptomyces sp. NBC_01728]WSI44667.1 hypothetical protein OG585_47290 [Streptomyces sp. NBC_01340]
MFRNLFRILLYFASCAAAGGGVAVLIAEASGVANPEDVPGNIGLAMGFLAGLAYLMYRNSPTVAMGRAMRDGDGAGFLARAFDRGATQLIPMRLSQPCGHGLDHIRVTTQLLTEMYDQDMGVQSRRLEALLRDAAKATRTEKGFSDSSTGTFISPGSSVTVPLRIARWDGSAESPGVIIGHDMH